MHISKFNTVLSMITPRSLIDLPRIVDQFTGVSGVSRAQILEKGILKPSYGALALITPHTLYASDCLRSLRKLSYHFYSIMRQGRIENDVTLARLMRIWRERCAQTFSWHINRMRETQWIKVDTLLMPENKKMLSQPFRIISRGIRRCDSPVRDSALEQLQTFDPIVLEKYITSPSFPAIELQDRKNPNIGKYFEVASKNKETIRRLIDFEMQLSHNKWENECKRKTEKEYASIVYKWRNGKQQQATKMHRYKRAHVDRNYIEAVWESVPHDVPEESFGMEKEESFGMENLFNVPNVNPCDCSECNAPQGLVASETATPHGSLLLSDEQQQQIALFGTELRTYLSGVETELEPVDIVNRLLQVIMPTEAHGVSTSRMGSAISGFLQLGDLASSISNFVSNIRAWFTQKFASITDWFTIYGTLIAFVVGFVISLIVTLLVSRYLSGPSRALFLTLTITAVIAMGTMTGVASYVTHKINDIYAAWTKNLPSQTDAVYRNGAETVHFMPRQPTKDQIVGKVNHYRAKHGRTEKYNAMTFDQLNQRFGPFSASDRMYFLDNPGAMDQFEARADNRSFDDNGFTFHDDESEASFENHLDYVRRQEEVANTINLTPMHRSDSDPDFEQEYDARWQENQPSLEADPQSGNLLVILHKAIKEICGFLNVNNMLMVTRLVNETSRMSGTLSSTFRFLLGLLPAVIQDVCLNKCPKLVSSFLFEQSQWKSYNYRIQKSLEALKLPTSVNIAEAEKLLANIKEYMTLHCGESWTTHVEKHVTEYESAIKDAATRVKTSLRGKTPAVFAVVGEPGIGKTEFLNALNKYLTHVIRGHPDPACTYSRGNGQFWEKVGSADIVTYPSFMETDAITNVQQANELMGLCNPGGYVATAAAIDKKDKTYCFSAVTFSSNLVYHTNIPNMNSAMVEEALNRRMQHKCYAALHKPAFPADFVMTAANVREWLGKLSKTDPAKAATFPHLRFYPLMVLPPVGQLGKIPQYNQGKDLREIYDLNANSILRENGCMLNVEQGMTADQYLHYCGLVLKAHGKRQDVSTQYINTHIDALARAHDLDVTPPEFDPKLDDSESAWKKILLGVGIGSASLIALTGILVACYKFANRKPTSDESEPHYGHRTRDAMTARQQESLARIRQNVNSGLPHGDLTNDPRKVFLDTLSQHTVKLNYSGTDSNMNGFLVNGQHLLTLRHLFYKDNAFVPGYLSIKYPIGESYMEQRIPIEEKQFLQLNENCTERAGTFFDDLVCIPFSQPIPGIRDRRGFFLQPQEDKNENFDNFVMFSGNRESAGNFISRFHAINYGSRGYEPIRAFDTFQYGASCMPGECGSPIWTVIKGTLRIVGLHSSGALTHSNGIFVTAQKLAKVPKEQYRQMSAMESTPHCLNGAFELTNKCRLPEGNYVPIGVLNHPIGSNSRTQLARTPFAERSDLYAYNLMTPDTETCRVAPAVLDSQIIWTQEEKYGLVRNPMPFDTLRYAEACSDRLYPPPNSALQEWTILEAVNSIPHDASVGFNWKEKRKDLLIWNADLQFYEPHDKLVEAIEQLSATTSQGVIPMTVIVPTNKDECRPLAKVAARITRTFQISPLHLLVFGTMVLGDYMMYIHKNPIHRPSTVGLDPASREWHMVFIQLMAPFSGDENLNLLDLDYKAMEANVTWQYYASYQRHLTRYYQDEGQTSWHRRNAYLLMMCQSLQAVGKSLYLRNVGNPSGMKGTTDLNTYVAGIMMAYAFKDCIPEASTGDYTSMVKSKYNGDDTAAKVHSCVADKYNFLTIQASLAKLNTVITPALKDQAPTPFVLPTEISFCKKQILYSQELQSLVPFVTFATLLDQLSFARDVTPSGLAQIINSALQWSFFRGNRKINGQIPSSEPTFDEQRNYMLSKIPESLWSSIVTYSELQYRFDHPRSQYNNQMTQTTISQSINASQLPSMTAVPHAMALISSLIPGLMSMHGPSNPPTPPVAPPAGFTINVGTTKECANSNVPSASAVPHSLNKNMPTVSFRHGELLHPAFNAQQISQVMDDEANRMTLHGPDEFMTSIDEMHHDFFAEHLQPTAKISVPTTSPQESFLFSADICPIDGGIPSFEPTEEYFTPTRLQFLYWMHKFWHGSLKMSLRFFAPREMTCRIAVSFLYGFSGDVSTITYTDSMEYPTIYYTFDSSNREVVFKVPDINPWRWKKRVDLVLNPEIPDQEFFDMTANGKIIVWLVTPISGINIPLNGIPYMYFSMCGGPDFSVRKFEPPPGFTNYTAHPTFDDMDSVVMIEEPKIQKITKSLSSVQLSNTRSRTAQPHSASSIVVPIPAEEAKVTSSSASLDAGTSVENGTSNVLATVKKQTVGPAKIVNSTVEPIEIMKIASKYFHLDTLPVTAASGVLFTQYNHPSDTLKAQALLVAETGRYFRGDLRVLVTVTTGSFSGGNLIAAFIPYGVGATAPTPVTREWITSFPYVLIDLASNKPIEIFIPYSYFLDYFDHAKTGITLPDMGRLYFFQEDFMSPTTAPKPTVINLQARWENFETFVPKTIPASITSARAALLASRTAIPHSGSEANVNNMVGQSIPMTSDEMQLTTTTVPLNHTPIPGSRGSFADQLTRPYPWYSASIELGIGARTLVALPNFPQSYAPPGADGPSDGQNAIFNTLSTMYAAFAGDTVFDIVARCDTTGVGMYVASLIGDEETNRPEAVSLLPLVFASTDPYPSRLTTPPTDGYTTNSMLPITTSQVPGKMRISTPMYSQTRYVGANDRVAIPSYNVSQTVLCLEAPSHGATDEKWTVKLEVYRSLMPGSRFALFIGMPQFNFDVLKTGPTTYVNYPNSKIHITP